ncbi:MAG: DUF4340 domain-containing protein [Treponema sp.]|nr:DUF4340 domain-containing protein [Treponema sp.]
MKARKLVLIIADLLLLALVIVQGIAKARDGVKNFTFEDSPDQITIVTPAETINLSCQDEKWFINDQKYPANDYSVEAFVESLSAIRALDKVASVNENNLNKYELVAGKKITVEAKKEGKLLRSIEIGKSASSASQSYITIDGGNSIYLASGSLRTSFDTSIKSLRSNTIWSYDANTLSSINIKKADGSEWGLTRIGAGDQTSWTISIPDTEVDSEKAKNFLESLANLTASNWYADDAKIEDLGGELFLTAKLGHTFETATLEIYQIPAQSDEEEAVYYAKSSESPYIFELSSYMAEKFNKNSEDVTK